MSTAALVVLLLVIALVAYVYYVARRRMLALQSKCRAAFDGVFGQRASPPRYEMKSSYGYPAFNVTFRSAADLTEAKEKGLNAKFLGAIGAICKGMGPKNRPFDASLAVYFAVEKQAGSAPSGKAGAE